MPLAYDRPGDATTIVHRWDGGFTWMAHPDEMMQRASHALAVGDDVWLVDPVDAVGLDDVVGELGHVAGVVVLSHAHRRQAERLAKRHEVAVHVPSCIHVDAYPITEFTVPVKSFDDYLGNSGFELVWTADAKFKQEGALYYPQRKTLVVSDILMTGLFAQQNGRLEVFPFYPLFDIPVPTTELGVLDVDRVLVGHGEPVVEQAQEALEDALAEADRGTAMAIARNLPTFSRQVVEQFPDIARTVYSELRN